MIMFKLYLWGAIKDKISHQRFDLKACGEGGMIVVGTAVPSCFHQSVDLVHAR